MLEGVGSRSELGVGIGSLRLSQTVQFSEIGFYISAVHAAQIPTGGAAGGVSLWLLADGSHPHLSTVALCGSSCVHLKLVYKTSRVVSGEQFDLV